MYKAIFLLIFGICVLAGCGRNGLYALSSETRQFIYGNGKVAFLGKPLNGVADCKFENSQQGYVFRVIENKLFIDSLRPSGTITQKVVKIKSKGDNFDIIAENGIKSRYKLSFTNISKDGIDIAFNDMNKQHFLRCEF